MRNAIRLLALSTVFVAGALADPPPAHATYSPRIPQYCCCEMVGGNCINRCCSTIGCSINANGCRTLTLGT